MLVLPPLVWSDKLEKDALKYAKVLARTNIFKHKTRNGENLTTFLEWEDVQGIRKHIYSPTSLYDASLGWYEEISDYRYSKVRKFRLSAKKSCSLYSNGMQRSRASWNCLRDFKIWKYICCS